MQPHKQKSKITTRLINLLHERGPLRGRQIDSHFAKVDWRKTANMLVKKGVLTSKNVLPPPRVRPKNIRVAQLHAQGPLNAAEVLALDYRLTSAEALADSGEQFDAVLNMEVVEHVENLPAFLEACGRLVRPGGIMVVATINRTLVALVIAILGAEYVLRWLPRGTHRWRKLVKPSEIGEGLGASFTLVHRTGVRINPFNRRFHHTPYLGVNYMLVLRKASEAV